jgi:hypothetical protein
VVLNTTVTNGPVLFSARWKHPDQAQSATNALPQVKLLLPLQDVASTDDAERPDLVCQVVPAFRHAAEEVTFLKAPASVL